MSEGAVRLRFESRLTASPEQVWAHAVTMQGVNDELSPWLRMSYPNDRATLDARPVRAGELLFQSWLCAFGFLPIDRHALTLERIIPGIGFDECSQSWMQRRWLHQRRVAHMPGGTKVVDVLEFVPRVALFAPLLRIVVGALFRHRHRRLGRRFGVLA